MNSRRRFLAGAGGVAVAGGLVLAQRSFGWLGASHPNAFNQASREMVRVGGVHQTPEGDISGDFYLTCQFALAAVCAGFDPKTVRINQNGRSVFDYFANGVQVNSAGARGVTDSLTRLWVSRSLGLDTEYRMSESQYLIAQRLTQDENGFQSLQDGNASLAYLPFGAIALQQGGASRANALFPRIETLLRMIRNEDGGYPERPGGESVADMSAAALLSGLAPRDGQTENFLLKLMLPNGEFAFNRADHAGSVGNVSSSALVHSSQPERFLIRELLVDRWLGEGRVDSFPKGDPRNLFDLFQAAQVLGKRPQLVA